MYRGDYVGVMLIDLIIFDNVMTLLQSNTSGLS